MVKVNSLRKFARPRPSKKCVSDMNVNNTVRSDLKMLTNDSEEVKVGIPALAEYV
jgi:hypothetical protein